jgi:hypothetical protein
VVSATQVSSIDDCKVLCEPGATLSQVYFPITFIVSLLYVMEDGASAEIAVVGNERIVGFRYSWEASRPPVAQWCKVLANVSGSQAMKDEFNRAGPVLHLLLRYTQALITQIGRRCRAPRQAG